MIYFSKYVTLFILYSSRYTSIFFIVFTAEHLWPETTSLCQAHYIRITITKCTCESGVKFFTFLILAIPDVRVPPPLFLKKGDIITLYNKIWVMSCPWGFDCRTLFVGYQNHRNGLFFRLWKFVWGRENFFSEKWAFSMRKGTKRFNSTGTPPTQRSWFATFRAVDGTHRIPKMCYISNLGENRIFAGYFNVTFCLNFTIFFKKFHFFSCRFFNQNWWKVRRTMTANRKKITMHGSDH